MIKNKQALKIKIANEIRAKAKKVTLYWVEFSDKTKATYLTAKQLQECKNIKGKIILTWGIQ